jgi:hypothetical protein
VMTARERINDHPAPLHRSRRRALARIAKVRSNSDTSYQNTLPKMQNQPTSDSVARVRAAAIVILRPTSSPKSHLAPIEIP